MHRRGMTTVLALVLAAALTAGCGGAGTQSGGAQESAPAETTEAETAGAEGEVQAKEAGAGQDSQEELPPYTVMIPDEKTEIALPIPENAFYGWYSAEHYLITAEENPAVLSTIENLSYMDFLYKRLAKTVAAVPVSAKFYSANGLKELTVWLKEQQDWDDLYAALQEQDAETADAYMENIRELCTIGIADFTFAEESGRTYSYNRYVYTLDGETMTCVPIEGVKDDYTIEYKENAEELTFHVEFRGDILRMENGDCSVALLPNQKWIWCTNSANPYVIMAAVEKPEDAYRDIVIINGSWSNAFAEKASFMQLTFADGSMTDFETSETVRTEPNTLTVTWKSRYDLNGNTYEEPGSITVRFLNGGDVLDPQFIIVDEEGKLYPYQMPAATYSVNNP